MLLLRKERPRSLLFYGANLYDFKFNPLIISQTLVSNPVDAHSLHYLRIFHAVQ